MAQQTINVGASPNDGTGTPLRTAFQYTNSNFSELYTAVGPSGNNIVVPGSATISGDLTVDTNVLKVDTTNNRVGVGTATPGVRVDILSDNNTSLAAVLRVNSNNAAVNTSLAYDGLVGSGAMTLQCGANPFIINTNGANERYRIASDGVATWSNVGGVAGTAMVLNSYGVGIGSVNALSGGSRKCLTINSGAGQLSILELAVNGTLAAYFYSNATQTSIVSQGATYLTFDTNSNERMRIDSSGNVGIGVTPSAWQTGTPAVQLKYNSSIWSNSDNTVQINQNAYFDGSSWKYVNATSLQASNYFQYQGSHSWRTAPSGTAGNAITWTQAMTLDASGSLVLGAAAVATTATDGFLYIPGCAGTPTGTPTAKTGRVPLVVDTTNNKLYFYSGGAWVAAN